MRSMRRLLGNATRGGLLTYSVFLGMALVCGVFIGKTVLDRGTGQMYPDGNLIMNWIENGYFRLAGMRWSETGTVKATYPWTYLFPAFLLEKIYFELRGVFSYRLLAIYNQSIIGISAASLGYFAFEAARHLGARRLQALLYGTCALAVYQSFPWNVAAYFRLFPTHFWMMFAPLLMALVMRELHTGPALRLPRCHYVLKFVLAFLIFYTEYVASFMLVFSIGILTFFIKQGSLDAVRLFRSILLPGLLGIGLFLLALLYLKLAYPDVTWSGSTFLYRSGLDGSTVYYGGSESLWNRTGYTPAYMRFAENLGSLSRWYSIFFLGCAGLALCLMRYSFTRSAEERDRIATVLVGSGALAFQYLLFAAALTQAAVTHPFGYDIYLAGPMIVFGFALLPVLVGRWLPCARALPPIVMLVSLFMFTSQLRLFAIVFPK